MHDDATPANELEQRDGASDPEADGCDEDDELDHERPCCARIG